jgi:hypothetical protein
MGNHNPITEIAPHFMTHGNNTVGVSAEKLVDANTLRRSILIQNLSASYYLYIGNADVSTSNSVQIAPGDSLALYVQSAIYAVASADTIDCRYLEEYCA